MSDKRYLWEIKLSCGTEQTWIKRFITEEPDAAFIDTDRAKQVFLDETLACHHVEQVIIEEMRRVTEATAI